MSGWLITFALLVLGPSSVSQAQRSQDPAFIVRNWTANDGLPVTGVNDIQQDNDGFLWLATSGGIARFDGIRFRVFDTGSNPELPSNRFTQFRLAAPGFFLLQTENQGALLFDGQRFLDLTQKFGFTKRSGYRILGDSKVWMFTDAGILEIDRDGNGQFVTDQPIAVYGGLEDEAGNEWMGAPTGLLRIDRAGKHTWFTTEDGLPGNDVRGLLPVHDGILVATTSGTGIFTPGGFRSLRFDDDPAAVVPGLFVQDVGGEILVATTIGWRRVDGNRLVRDFAKGRFPVLDRATMSSTPAVDERGDFWYELNGGVYRNDQLVLRASGNVTRILPNRGGGVWVSYNAEGLFLIMPSAVQTIGIAEGLPGENAYALIEDPQGGFWVGLLDQRQFVRVRNGQPDLSVSMGEPWAAGIDALDNVWLGGESICRMQGDRCVPETIEGLVPPVRAIWSDRQARLWVGAQGGLWVRPEP